MTFHRPNFLVSKNEATKKLFQATYRGNINSARRQLNRGANVTAKMRFNNYSPKEINLYKTLKKGIRNNTNKKKVRQFLHLLNNAGFKTKDGLTASEKNTENEFTNENFNAKPVNTDKILANVLKYGRGDKKKLPFNQSINWIQDPRIHFTATKTRKKIGRK